jgi:uncharacterized cupredoxin-like copper-binding protein
LTRFRPLTALAAMLALLTAAACGGSSGSSTTAQPTSSTPAASSSTGGGKVVEIDVAQSGFAFTKTSLTVPAGTVTLRSKNPQGVPHAIAIKGNGVDKAGEVVSAGGISEVTADLKPGTYTFFCPVPGHEEAGMKGTLTVT